MKTIVRKMIGSEIPTLADLWLATSIKAHDFIPAQYWKDSRSLMAEIYLPQADVFVAEEESSPLGFIAMVGSHIAAIFVMNGNQGRGIGKSLLNYVKGIHPEMTLKVYQKNEGSVGFYTSQGFTILSEEVDQLTGEKEFVMQWKQVN